MTDFSSLPAAAHRQNDDEVAVARGVGTLRMPLSVLSPQIPTHIATTDLSDYEGLEDAATEGINARLADEGLSVTGIGDYYSVWILLFRKDEQPGSQAFTDGAGRTSIHWIFDEPNPTSRRFAAILETGDEIIVNHTDDNGRDVIRVESVTNTNPSTFQLTGRVILRGILLEENDLGFGDTGIQTVTVRLGSGNTGILVRQRRSGKIVTAPVLGREALASDGTVESYFRSLKGRPVTIATDENGVTTFRYDASNVLTIVKGADTTAFRATAGRVKGILRDANGTHISYHPQITGGGTVQQRDSHSGVLREFAYPTLANTFGPLTQSIDAAPTFTNITLGEATWAAVVTGAEGHDHDATLTTTDASGRSVTTTYRATIVSDTDPVDPA